MRTVLPYLRAPAGDRRAAPGLLARLVRPAGAVEEVRRAFGVLATLSIVLSLPALLPRSGSPAQVAGVLAAAALLTSSQLLGYALHRVTLSMDVIDAAALGVVCFVGGSSTTSGTVVFAAVWFRSLYGSLRRAVARAILYLVALGTAALAAHAGPGPSLAHAAPAVLGPFPVVLATALVSRQLLAILEEQVRSTRLERVIARVGSTLIGVTDTAEIRAIAWEAVEEICSAFPGLQILHATRDGDVLRIDRASRGVDPVPTTVACADVRPAVPADGPATLILAAADLDTPRTGDRTSRTAGARRWTATLVPATDESGPGGWLLIGAPAGVHGHAEAAVDILRDQTTLALLTSAVHRRLEVQATRDDLTGLANRGAFTDALAVALQEGGNPHTTVLFVDLDDFKDVNDQLGHRAGDELLVAVAHRLRAATGPGDLCARIGGDEFAVLLPGADADAGDRVGWRIVDALAAPLHLAAESTVVTASVGVATAAPPTTLEQLMHRADVAMYAAKADGKGRVRVFERDPVGTPDRSPEPTVPAPR